MQIRTQMTQEVGEPTVLEEHQYNRIGDEKLNSPENHKSYQLGEEDKKLVQKFISENRGCLDFIKEHTQEIQDIDVENYNLLLKFTQDVLDLNLFLLNISQ